MKRFILIISLCLACSVVSAQINISNIRLGKSDFSPITGSRIFTKGVLTEDIAAGEIVAVDGHLALKTANPDSNPSGSIYSIDSTDNGFLAVGHSGTTTPARLRTYRWSAINSRYETTAAPPLAPDATVSDCCLSADGSFLVAAYSTSNRIKTYKWSSTHNRYEATANPDVLPGSTVTSTSISSDGSILAVTIGVSPYLRTYKWSSANNRYEATADASISPALDFSARSCALSGDGSKLVFAHNSTYGFRTLIWSEANNRFESGNNPDTIRACIDLNMSKDGNYLVILTSFTNAELFAYKWSTANARFEAMPNFDYQVSPTLTIAASQYTKLVKLSDDGSRLVVACYNDPKHQIIPYQLDSISGTYKRLPMPDIIGNTTNNAVSILPNGSRLIYGGNTSSFYSYLLPPVASSVYSIYKPLTTINPILLNYKNLAYGYLNETGTTGQTKSMTALSWSLYPTE